MNEQGARWLPHHLSAWRREQIADLPPRKCFALIGEGGGQQEPHLSCTVPAKRALMNPLTYEGSTGATFNQSMVSMFRQLLKIHVHLCRAGGHQNRLKGRMKRI